MSLQQVYHGAEPSLHAQLTREPLYNLFLLSNLRLGLGPDLEAWEDQAGGVLMRYLGNWLLEPGPNPASFDYKAAAAIMDAYPPAQVMGLTGRPEAVDPLHALVRRHQGKTYQQMFAALQGAPAAVTASGEPRPARPSDLDALTAIYADAGDMSRPRSAVERMLPNCWVVEEQGQIACVAAAMAQTDQAAMVGGVFTPVQYRGHGHASTVVHALSSALLAAGKQPCLFYHNPTAGRIYLRLGYQELGPWRMVKYAPASRV